MMRFARKSPERFFVSIFIWMALLGSARIFAESENILPRDTVWKYEDSGVDLGTEWRNAEYPDVSWKSGVAPLGFGDAFSETDPTLPIGTIVGYGPNADDKHMTTYFRTEVNIPALSALPKEVRVYVHVDDGAVVYINGLEAFRRGIKDGVRVTYTTGAKFKPKEETFALPSSIFREGKNVIAAEVHQDDGSSSDLWFELGIDAGSSDSDTRSLGDTSTVVVPDPNAPLGAVTKAVATIYGDAKSEMGFTWYTTTASDGSDVQITEKTGATPDFTKAKTFTGNWSHPLNSPNEVLHKSVASGLTSGSTYWYRVGDASRDLWSEVGTFRTASPSGSFTFIDLADPQSKTEDEAILSAETIAAAVSTVKDASFLAINGDLVDVGMVENQWDWLFDHSAPSLRSIPLVPVSGNHDEDKNSFIDHFNLKTPVNSPTRSGAYYSFDWSSAHFIVLNTNEDSPEWADLTPAQVAWFRSDAEKAKTEGAVWIIVLLHKGPYTTSNHATDKDMTDENGVRSKFAPILAEAGADLVLQGHDHIYARSLPIAEGVVAEYQLKKGALNGKPIDLYRDPQGPMYIIPATAGPKTYYRNKKMDHSYFSLFAVADENHAARHGPDKADPSRPTRGAVQNFMAITVDGATLTAVVYEIDATVNGGVPYIVDQFGITK